ncbi:MAG TPA: GAF domain-containing sensor histidine kinase [Patescibacteria group bacterium]|nr:GAF domain-containing sensor histidine kinase [Patescibacteria group bacterium]
MDLPASLALATIFGILAIAISIKEERLRKAVKIQTQEQKQKLFQIQILKEIQDRIGYSLDIEEIIDVLTGSLKHLFPYSTASSMVIKEDRIVFKTYIEERVSHQFVQSVKQSMMASLQALLPAQAGLPTLPKKIEDVVTGAPFNDINVSSFSSFFHIPLVVNNKVVGIINISSTQKNLYKESEMTILYQITEQASNALTRLQQVLETEKGKLTSMIASLADGVFMLDNEKRILIINDAAKRFLQVSSTPTFFDVLNAFPREYDLGGRIEKVGITKLPVQEQEAQIGNKIFQIFITPVLSPELSKTLGVAVLLHDITLERNLAKEKEDFTNMMVHELRAPLTAIKDSAELMTEKKLEPSEYNQLLSIINSQAKLLLEQVTDVLDASKIEAGRLVLSRQQANLSEIIQSVYKIFQPVAQKKNITVSTQIQSLPPLLIDRIRINQVLNNLISNSIKFTNDGGKIKIAALQKGNSVEVSVSDTGIGIPLDKQRDIFSKFYQVGGVEHKDGTGLGLFIVKGIIEAHKGSVTLNSEEGKGTTISFTIPITSAQPFQVPNFRTLN